MKPWSKLSKRVYSKNSRYLEEKQKNKKTKNKKKTHRSHEEETDPRIFWGPKSKAKVGGDSKREREREWEVGSNEEGAVERLVLQPHGGKLERRKENMRKEERKENEWN